MVILVIYFAMLLAILDTMRLHKIFSCQGSGGSQWNINLYFFYFMAIMVCLGRFLQ